MEHVRPMTQNFDAKDTEGERAIIAIGFWETGLSYQPIFNLIESLSTWQLGLVVFVPIPNLQDCM